MGGLTNCDDGSLARVGQRRPSGANHCQARVSRACHRLCHLPTGRCCFQSVGGARPWSCIAHSAELQISVDGGLLRKIGVCLRFVRCGSIPHGSLACCTAFRTASHDLAGLMLAKSPARRPRPAVGCCCRGVCVGSVRDVAIDEGNKCRCRLAGIDRADCCELRM